MLKPSTVIDQANKLPNRIYNAVTTIILIR
jgi:hypothetical protein